MNTETIKTEDIPEIIPLKERNTFQILLMQRMIGEDATDGAMVTWSNTHGKIVSDIIDDAENESIRSLIMNHEYEVAVQEILELLK